MKRNIIMFEKLFKLTNIFVNNVSRIVFQVIYQTRKIVFDICDKTSSHVSNTEKRVENTKHGGVFLTNFEVFDIAMKHCDKC